MNWLNGFCFLLGFLWRFCGSRGSAQLSYSPFHGLQGISRALGLFFSFPRGWAQCGENLFRLKLDFHHFLIPLFYRGHWFRRLSGVHSRHPGVKKKLWVATVQGGRLFGQEGDTKHTKCLAAQNHYSKVCQLQVIQLIRNPCLV